MELTNNPIAFFVYPTWAISWSRRTQDINQYHVKVMKTSQTFNNFRHVVCQSLHSSSNTFNFKMIIFRAHKALKNEHFICEIYFCKFKRMMDGMALFKSVGSQLGMTLYFSVRGTLFGHNHSWISLVGMNANWIWKCTHIQHCWPVGELCPL